MAAPAAEPRPALARAVLIAALAAGAVVFCAAVIASIRQNSGSGGVMTGIFAGLFGGLLVALAGAWFAMWLAGRSIATPIDTALGENLAASLADVLAELEATRRDLYAQAMARAARRVPLGMAAGALLWLLTRSAKQPGGVVELIFYLGIGGVAGYFWATSALDARYVRLYKDRVLPRLAASFGAISYREAVTPDLDKLRAEHVFADFNEHRCDDELFGNYRGLDVSIMELSLHKREGERRSTVFHGLVAQVTLPRNLSGVTAVIADEGMIDEVLAWTRRGGTERVRVEDPEFNAGWHIYGTDQIGARALLTPAFMERFKKLAQRPGFGKPLALADANHLLLALPRWGGSLFKVPSFNKPAASRDTLIALHDGIVALLATFDAVIDLDQGARATAARQTRGIAASI